MPDKKQSGKRTGVHLKNCPGCNEYLAGFNRGNELINKLRTVIPESETAYTITKNVMASIENIEKISFMEIFFLYGSYIIFSEQKESQI